MSSLLSAELAATCNALGYFDVKENKYYADGNTLETVKDLIRYLRKDDENHDIRRHLGETKVVQTDLLPLMKSYWEEIELFDVLLRLLVNLTMPALILWQEEPPTEKTARNYYLQIETHLQDYKQAFADEAIWAVLSTRISKILEIDYAERGDENGLIIERILILIRNILYIPIDPDAERRPDNDASIHDQVLWSLYQSGMLDIIMYIASSTMEQAYYMHVLEILSFMLREQNPSELANAELQRSQTEKLRDEAELLAIRHRESGQRQQKLKMYNGTRHSRFGGTYVVKTMKSISDNELIYHKPLSRLESLDFDVDKKKVKTPKNRLPLQSTSTERRSAFSIRLFLKEFCIEFLNGAYNTIMCQVKRNLVRTKSQNHDESYYLWAMRFFMEFNRCYKFEVKLVSETMSVQTFHYVQQQMEHHFDMINQDKKKFRLWSRRLHLALLAYRELLLTICAMDKSSMDAVKHSAKVIKSNIFYVLEYRELVLTLLITFDELKMSPAYLNDLIECQHIFFKMLQSYCDGGNTQIVVQKKARAKKRTKKREVERPSDSEKAAGKGEDLEGRWDEMAPQLSVILEGGAEIANNVVPFDVTSDVPIDDQKSEAMKNIQRKLQMGDYEEALGLLRASREVWPENDCFGSSNMAPQEEFLALRDIFFADLGARNEGEPESGRAESENRNEYVDEDNEEEEEDGFEDEHLTESDFKFQDFAKRLAHPKIVRACGLALRNFDRNSVTTNHCIIKLLHRIAWDCKMSAMIFQVSILRTFQKIYDSKDAPQFKELLKFANYVVKEFINVAEKNPKVYIEALFWKSSRDAYDIEEGYGSYQQKSAAATKAWTELEEDELRRLFMEHQENQIEEDVVDWILNNLIDSSARTRRGVLKKLKELYLLTEYKARKPSSNNARPPKHWNAEEEAQLRELYEQFKDANDPLGCIMERLDVRRPKNRIVEKLLVMGLIQDKKELRKKRTKSRHVNGTESGDDDSMLSDLEENDETEERSTPVINTQRKVNQRKRGPPPKHASMKSQKKRKPKSARASKTELTKLLVSVVNTGSMSEALEWIKESFADAAEDMEDDTDTDDTGIPIVPILECSITAMEDSQFQKLLLAFGMAKPADEQETYWRIPYNLTHTILKEHCHLITQALEGNLQVEEVNINDDDQPTTQSRTIDPRKQGESSSDDDEYVFSNLRKPSASENINVTTRNSEEEPSISAIISNGPKRKKVIALEDSDDDDLDEGNEVLETDEVENLENGKRSRLSDSDNERPAYKKSKTIAIVDSEDED